MMTLNNPKLRNTHPNLWFAYLMYGFWGLFMGFSFIVLSKWLGGWFTALLGVGYLITGGTKLVGTYLENASLVRKGIIGCIMLSFFVGFVAITTAPFIFEAEPIIAGLLIILGGTVMFCGSIIQFAPLQEPPINPLTMKKD